MGKVIGNIRKINELKGRYATGNPDLVLQFILFSFNVGEMARAAALARLLNMKLHFHLNAHPDPMPEEDRNRVRNTLGYATREEFARRTGRHYMRHLCYQMWIHPQINWDGRLLGCCKNMRLVYAENVFRDGLKEALDADGMRQARRALSGEAPMPSDLPCGACDLYQSLAASGDWIRGDEIEAWSAEPPSSGSHAAKGVL